MDNATQKDWYRNQSALFPASMANATSLTRGDGPDNKRYRGPGTLRNIPMKERTRRYGGQR